MNRIRQSFLLAGKAIECRITVKVVRGTASTSHIGIAQREKNVVYSPFPSVEIPQEGVASIIFNKASKWSDREAIECGLTGRKYTFGQVIDRALRWGNVVNQMMPSSSESRNLMYISSNVPEFPIILLGTLAVGAVITTCNDAYTVDEVARQLHDCDAQMVVVEPQMEGVIRDAFQKLQISLPVFVNGSSEYASPNLREIIEDDAKPFAELIEPSTESIAAILYSSGTTGIPKGVALSHRALSSNVVMLSHPDLSPYVRASEASKSTFVGLLPFFHVYGFNFILFALFSGMKIVSLPSFNPNEFIRVIREHKVDVVHLVPPLLNFLITSDVTSSDLTSIRYALCGAAPVPPSSAQAFKEKAPNPVIFQEGFGLTETLGTHLTPVREERIGWCGKPICNVAAKVIDLTTGEALPEGQKGELCIKTPSMMSYYLNNPEATAETIDSEGWLHTGDVAVHKEEFFSIVDRLKELIKVKGYQVSPSEIEEELLKHPGVLDVGVVGVEDERAGELPRAYVVKKPGSETTAEQLMHHMEQRLASYKQLDGGIKFVETLPKSATGKLLRKELKNLAASES